MQEICCECYRSSRNLGKVEKVAILSEDSSFGRSNVVVRCRLPRIMDIPCLSEGLSYITVPIIVHGIATAKADFVVHCLFVDAIILLGF